MNYIFIFAFHIAFLGKLALSKTISSIYLQIPYYRNEKYYVVPITIGEPPQTFNVQVDTSTSTTWVPSVSCRNCRLENAYNCNNSTKAQIINKKVELDDEDGDVEGLIVFDTLNFGGISLERYGFVKAEELEDDFHDHIEGKLGLGFRGELGHDFNLIEKLKHEAFIPKRIFSLKQINESFGLLEIGDIQVSSQDQLSFCNVTSAEDLDDEYKESWICQMSHISITDKKIPSEQRFTLAKKTKSDYVEFDSGYRYIAIPYSEITTFKSILFDKYLAKECSLNEEANMDDVFVFRCNHTEIPELSFNIIIQGFAYSIPLNELFMINNADNKMEFLVRFIKDDEAIWTLGYPFMSRFTIIFNMEERNVGIQGNKTQIIDITPQWTLWVNRHNTEKKVTKIIFITLLSIICAVILLVIISYLVFRAIKRKSMEQNFALHDTNKQY